jgi:hypothetical protein
MPPSPEQVRTACHLLDDLTRSYPHKCWYFEHIKALPAIAAILGAERFTQVAISRECADRIARMRDKELRYTMMSVIHEESFPWEANLILSRLLRRKLPWTSEDLAYLVNRIADLGEVCLFSLPFLPLLGNVVQRELQARPMTEELRQGLERLAAAIVRPYRAAEKRLWEQLTSLAGRPVNQASV